MSKYYEGNHFKFFWASEAKKIQKKKMEKPPQGSPSIEFMLYNEYKTIKKLRGLERSVYRKWKHMQETGSPQSKALRQAELTLQKKEKYMERLRKEIERVRAQEQRTF